MVNDDMAKESFVEETVAMAANGFVCTDIEGGRQCLRQIFEKNPKKLAGHLLVLFRAGSPFVLEINLEEVAIEPDDLLVVHPGNMVRRKENLPADLKCYVLFFDTTFSQNVNINLTSIATPSRVERPRPTMHLTEEEGVRAEKYFSLIKEVSGDGTDNRINSSIITSLTAALIYQLVLFYHKRLPVEITRETAMKGSARRREYVREFVKLVHLHYVRERSVSFYADRLFISSKYLSMLVKEATGRSAANWIDDFVIMEAKNLLRFSGKNIQQVAYALNFPTQSSFGKYFKHLTGLSPSEYQKS